jgi:hypothetical protein
MQHFIRNSLGNISNILKGMPLDCLLYGKAETVLSSALASSGNINVPSGQYYRTEVNNIDIVRKDSSGNILFACENKYIYTSDLNRYIVLNNILPKFELFDNYIGESINYVDYILCYAMKQISNYIERTEAANNYLVLLNMVFLPHGTNGNLTNNSGLKYINKQRLNSDSKIYNQCSQNNIEDYIDNQIKELPLVKQCYPNIQNCFKIKTELSSNLDFKYYIITLGYSV